MQIQINDTTYPADGITVRGEALSIQMPRGEWTLETLMEALAPGSAPQVRVLDEEGVTTAIYAAHAVTELALTQGDSVRVGMQVEPLEQTQADALSERMAAQARTIEAQQTHIEEQAQQLSGQAALLGAARVASRMAVAAGVDAMHEEEIDAVRRLFDPWEADRAYAADHDIVSHGEGALLYICRTSHTSQAGWEPGAEGTESLWACIDKVHAGTEDDPIPYAGNMALEAGKHYSQDGVTYRCTRDTQIPVYQTLAELVGIYVEAVQEGN